jgi:nucleotide-binding universal stress UspA family protein
VEVIVRTAEEKACDLIVLGSHGYGMLKDALMGGTARGVIRRTRKPVLLVRLPEEDE